MRRGILTLLGVALLTGQALAVDTWEPYPKGPGTLEFYAVRYGHGAAADSLRGYATMLGPAWGLSPTAHAYLFTGISSGDDHRGGVDFLTLGLFRNFYEGRALKLDGWAQMSAFGPGLGLSARQFGLEYNLDLNRWGMFARTAWEWENEGVGDDGAALIGRRTLYTEGIYVQPSGRVQLLAELNQETLSGFDTLANESRTTSWAFGYNRVVSETTEMILEARTYEAPEGGERTWDFTLGAVTVW